MQTVAVSVSHHGDGVFEHGHVRAHDQPPRFFIFSEIRTYLTELLRAFYKKRRTVRGTLLSACITNTFPVLEIVGLSCLGTLIRLPSVDAWLWYYTS
jgi:hypothetical protein